MKAPKTLRLDELTQDPRNARIHTVPNLEAIAKSLKRFGAGRSIVLDSEGVVRAGNGTLQAARQAGFEKVMVVEADGKTLIAVRRPDWSSAEATAYAIADNRASELGSWDKEVLQGIFAELAPQDEELRLLDATGFSEQELAAILATAPEAQPEPDGDENGVPATTFVKSCPKCGHQWE